MRRELIYVFNKRFLLCVWIKSEYILFKVNTWNWSNNNINLCLFVIYKHRIIFFNSLIFMIICKGCFITLFLQAVYLISIKIFDNFPNKCTERVFILKVWIIIHKQWIVMSVLLIFWIYKLVIWKIYLILISSLKFIKIVFNITQNTSHIYTLFRIKSAFTCISYSLDRVSRRMTASQNVYQM